MSYFTYDIIGKNIVGKPHNIPGFQTFFAYCTYDITYDIVIDLVNLTTRSYTIAYTMV